MGGGGLGDTNPAGGGLAGSGVASSEPPGCELSGVSVSVSVEAGAGLVDSGLEGGLDAGGGDGGAALGGSPPGVCANALGSASANNPTLRTSTCVRRQSAWLRCPMMEPLSRTPRTVNAGQATPRTRDCKCSISIVSTCVWRCSSVTQLPRQTHAKPHARSVRVTSLVRCLAHAPSAPLVHQKGRDQKPREEMPDQNGKSSKNSPGEEHGRTRPCWLKSAAS